tara:strand:- start:14 stop:298 length:285 start_codon:yes stop_codon:yes gene_type:complete
MLEDVLMVLNLFEPTGDLQGALLVKSPGVFPAPRGILSEAFGGATRFLGTPAGPRRVPAHPNAMGCCTSKSAYAVEEPGAYEARRAKMLEAADT